MSVPTAETDLLSLLTTTFPDPTTLVRYAAPAELPSQHERVYVVGTEGYVRGDAEQWREETFGLQVVVEVFGSGDNPKQVSDRRWAMIAAIDSALIDDDFYGYRTEGGSIEEEGVLVAYDNGHIASSTITINVEHRF